MSCYSHYFGHQLPGLWFKLNKYLHTLFQFYPDPGFWVKAELKSTGAKVAHKMLVTLTPKLDLSNILPKTLVIFQCKRRKCSVFQDYLVQRELT
jgi:hypothetical protein